MVLILRVTMFMAQVAPARTSSTSSIPLREWLALSPVFIHSMISLCAFYVRTLPQVVEIVMLSAAH
jgi:hypothetical protein